MDHQRPGRISRLAFGPLIAFLYGASLRLFYHFAELWTGRSHSLDAYMPNDAWVMTAGFLVLSPFAAGWISVRAFGTKDSENHWARWILLPWVAVLCCDLALLLGAIEGWICIVMSLPITFLFSSVGGVVGGFGTRRKFLRQRSMTLCLAFLPILISGIEMQLDAPLSVRTVRTSIVIHAPAPVVWANIERVSAIRPTEIAPTWTHAIGFPLPIEATLDHEGIGGVRHASFQGGLIFVETINRWKPQQEIAFTIAADTAQIPATTLDEHVTIGGRYFDVLNGEYRLEPLPDGSILLHLSSQERLNTDFNAYAALWTDAVMRDLQESILEVVKHRCEDDSAAISARLKE